MLKIISVIVFLGSLSFYSVHASDRAPFQVGAAKVDITPAEDNLPQGYFRIHDQLFCRAIVVDNGASGAALIAIAGVNAEVYNIIAQKLKDESPYTNTIFSSITNGRSNSGYIPNDDAFQRYTFQVLSSSLKPNHAERGIIDGLVEMMTEVE